MKDILIYLFIIAILTILHIVYLLIKKHLSLMTIFIHTGYNICAVLWLRYGWIMAIYSWDSNKIFDFQILNLVWIRTIIIIIIFFLLPILLSTIKYYIYKKNSLPIGKFFWILNIFYLFTIIPAITFTVPFFVDKIIW